MGRLGNLGRVAWVLATRSRWVTVYPPGSRPVALRGDLALACRNLPSTRSEMTTLGRTGSTATQPHWRPVRRISTRRALRVKTSWPSRTGAHDEAEGRRDTSMHRQQNRCDSVRPEEPMMGRPTVVSGMAGVPPAAHRQGCAGPPLDSLLNRTGSRLPRLQHVLPSEPHAAKRDHPPGGNAAEPRPAKTLTAWDSGT
jgi:hypothetical protein